MQILVATIAFLLPSAEHSSVETDKKVGGTWAPFSLEFIFGTYKTVINGIACFVSFVIAFSFGPLVRTFCLLSSLLHLCVH